MFPISSKFSFKGLPKKQAGGIRGLTGTYVPLSFIREAGITTISFNTSHQDAT